MPTLTTIPLTLAQIAACAYVLYVSLMVLRIMSSSTRHLVRLSYLSISAGALAGVISGLTAPTFANTIMAIGLALFLAVNERRASCGLSN